jgi:nitronate monooxygenase
MPSTNFLGTELPIIQAPMAGAQDSALAIAVCNAGGLGSLPCAMLGTDALRAELATIRSQTRGAYNVNFFCHTPPEPSEQKEQAWRAALAPYFAEYGIDASAISAAPVRRPFSPEALAVLEEFRPSVVSFAFGLPSADLLRSLRGMGAKILASATTVDEARWLEAHGADAVIAQGLEAGGHRAMFLSNNLDTQLGTFALLPQVVRAVRIPVVAAGGIADATGVAAAFALGATAVQIGTAYLLCTEAATSNVPRAALKSDAAHLTALTNLFSGGAARGIMNRIMKELGPINAAAPAFPLATAAIAPLRARAEAAGRGDFSPLWAGQNASGCKEIPAAALTRELANGVPRH